MPLTTVNLFRLGNGTSARLDRIRTPQTTPNARRIDVVTFNSNGVWHVRGRSGGASTFDQPMQMSGRWWRLPAGTAYSPLLHVWNNHSCHWQWEPAVDMIFSDYIRELARVNSAFV